MLATRGGARANLWLVMLQVRFDMGRIHPLSRQSVAIMKANPAQRQQSDASA